eukprot:comp8063_c0_seq1/m.8516 comp8063_c0_seq1/g.8516  ORF comp8063_c0_seq1/g.8516 comp8063_c0_seq1/m.8516 type:complete len:141 (+) comp8063_c0_seq1:107-529(+)
MSFEISEEAFEAFNKIKIGNAENAALILKANKDTLQIELEEHYPSIKPEALAEELSLSAPRFIVYSYKISRADGRTQYPLTLVAYTPQGGNPALNMLYARAKPAVIIKFAIDDSKVYDIDSADTLTHDWLHAKLCGSYTR